MLERNRLNAFGQNTTGRLNRFSRPTVWLECLRLEPAFAKATAGKPAEPDEPAEPAEPSA